MRLSPGIGERRNSSLRSTIFQGTHCVHSLPGMVPTAVYRYFQLCIPKAPTTTTIADAARKHNEKITKKYSGASALSFAGATQFYQRR